MDQPTIYNIHPVTLELVGVGVADPDPLEPGKWLVPAFSTMVRPPKLAANKCAVFTDGSWSLVDDYRGVTYWVEDGTRIKISELGISPPENALFEKPPLTRKEVEELRLHSYADPITGSDRFFAEVMRLQATGGQIEEIETARAFGVARYAEIQAMFQWPS